MNKKNKGIGKYLRVFKGVKMPWLLILLSAAFSIAMGRSEIASATLTGSIIDGAQNAINGKELTEYIGVTVLAAVLSIASTYFLRKMEEVLNMRIRVKLWRKIMHLPTSYYDVDSGAELVSRVTGDASAPATLFDIIVVVGSSIYTIVRSFIQLYDTNVMLANYSLIMVPVILAVFAGYSVLQFKLGVYSTKVTATAMGYLTERVQSFRLIKSAVAEKIEAKLGNKNFKKMYIAEFLSWLSTAVFQVISNLTSIIFIVIVFVIGGQLVPKGEVTVGDLTSFYMTTSIVGVHLGLFFINAGSLFSTLGNMKKIADVMDTPNEKEYGDDVPLICADITFDDVSFAYDEEREVIKNLSVKIPMGRVTAIIGGNGAGKSTLFKLLTRLYEPNGGKVLFAEDDISRYDLTQWRDRFAYVFQKDPLIGGTVRENLTYGLEREVTDEELVEVTKKANCYDCIMEKPNGFDEDVGLDGSNFSGGQGQCISIARAMLRDADILLLDEATSNLDCLSEAAVTQAMDNLMRDKTTIMIAHNYAATRNADYIIVMKDGALEAAGTPDELLESNTYYQAFTNVL